LKKRFPLLKVGNHYPIESPIKIHGACVAVLVDLLISNVHFSLVYISVYACMEMWRHSPWYMFNWSGCMHIILYLSIHYGHNVYCTT
jgi:hypothetical protein